MQVENKNRGIINTQPFVLSKLTFVWNILFACFVCGLLDYAKENKYVLIIDYYIIIGILHQRIVFPLPDLFLNFIKTYSVVNCNLQCGFHVLK